MLLVTDAMIGQEAVKVAQGFHEALGLTGVVLTKMDGDARGGAALSIRGTVGVPVRFVGVGERPDALSRPDEAEAVAEDTMLTEEAVEVLEAGGGVGGGRAEELEGAQGGADRRPEGRGTTSRCRGP